MAPRPVRRRPPREGRSLFYALRVLMYFIGTYKIHLRNATDAGLYVYELPNRD